MDDCTDHLERCCKLARRCANSMFPRSQRGALLLARHAPAQPLIPSDMLGKVAPRAQGLALAPNDERDVALEHGRSSAYLLRIVEPHLAPAEPEEA